MFYNNLKKTAIENYKKEFNSHELLVREVNDAVMDLYEERKLASAAIGRVEAYINTLANIPKEFKQEIGAVSLSLKEFRDAVAFEKQSQQANVKGAGIGTAGTIVGTAVATLGPTTAMAIATAFGTASTGTAISALSGAAATNAALAWLGGGALAAGGGGMAAGNALLALAGPIGWGIGATAIIAGGIFTARKNKKAAEQANNERIKIMKENEYLRSRKQLISKTISSTKKLRSAIDLTVVTNLFPADYSLFNTEQKQKLAAIINATKALGEEITKKVA